MKHIVVAAERVGRAYGLETILEDVSLAIRAGELTTVVGPSGSGKTTLLALLALLLEPTSGRILIDGRDASSLSDAERSRLRNDFYGFVFQTAQLVGSLSVLDNVLLPATLKGVARSKRDDAVGLLDRLGLLSRARFLPHQLSLGQKRRVALARALVLQPKVILADEPTNDLDPKRAKQIADFLLGLPREGYAVVLVTHDHALAERAGNRYLIDVGRLGPMPSPKEEESEGLSYPPRASMDGHIPPTLTRPTGERVDALDVGSNPRIANGNSQ